MAAPKLALHETMELLSRVLGTSEADPDLSALSAALKPKLGLPDLEKPPPTMSLWSGTVDQGCEELQRHPQLPNRHLSQPFPPSCEDCACLQCR